MKKVKLFLSLTLLLAVLIVGAMSQRVSADWGLKCNCTVYVFDQRGRKHLLYHGVFVTIESDGVPVTICDAQTCEALIE